jgi:protein TonB
VPYLQFSQSENPSLTRNQQIAIYGRIAGWVGAIGIHIGLLGWYVTQPVDLLLSSAQPADVLSVSVIEMPAATPSVQPVDSQAVETNQQTTETIQEKAVEEFVDNAVKIVKKKSISAQKKQTQVVDSHPQENKKQYEQTVATTGAAQPIPSAAMPVTAARYDANYLNNPAPAYPPIARRLGEEGRVLLSVQVSGDGKPLNISVKQSSGYNRLDAAASKAVLNWRFVPAHQGESTMSSWVDIPVQFSLKK